MVSLMRMFAGVRKDGKVAIRDNIRRARLQPGQLVEVMALAKKGVVISPRGTAR